MSEIFLWIVKHDLCSANEQSLSPDEIERADRFKLPELRNQFVAGRSWLRNILSLHFKCGPRDIAFVTGEHGKPAIARPASNPHCFSYSRSHDYSICATSLSHEIGVDIEVCSPIDDEVLTAQTIFGSSDFLTWQELPEENRLEAFYRAWTRKESVGKAVGIGISDGPETIEVPIEAFPSSGGRAVCYRSESILISDFAPFLDSIASVAVVLGRDTRATEIAFSNTFYESGSNFELQSGAIAVPDATKLMVRSFEFGPETIK